MIRYLRIIASDFLGLARVGGLWLAIRWLWQVLLHLPECRRRRDLQPADRAMGQGPFTVHSAGSTAKVIGDGVITGVRETWVRGVYTGSPGMEQMPTSGTFLDLGANMGNVTLMALGRSPNVTAVSVESSPYQAARLKQSLEVNGWENRAQICHAFVGGETDFQIEQKKTETAQVPTISEEELISRYALTRIAYLKCDIEGSEFALLKPGSKLLAITDRIAIEVHDNAGDRNAFINMLKQEGFQVTLWRDDPVCCTLHCIRQP